MHRMAVKMNGREFVVRSCLCDRILESVAQAFTWPFRPDGGKDWVFITQS